MLQLDAYQQLPALRREHPGEALGDTLVHLLHKEACTVGWWRMADSKGVSLLTHIRF